MKTKIFTIYDCKAEAYLQPIFMQTVGTVLRALTSSVNDPNHQFHQYPEDYTLFELGEYEDSTGKFELHKAPIPLDGLITLKKTQPAQQPLKIVGDEKDG